MELAKKPVWFLCNKDSETFTISVPKTQHPFRFYRNQPHLIHYTLDIEFFDEHFEFNRVDNFPEPEVPEEETLVYPTDDFKESEPETEGVDEAEEKRLEAIEDGAENEKENPPECTVEGCDEEIASANSKHCPKHLSEEELEEMKKTDLQTYSKKELQEMRKSDVREILKELAPEKSCPIRKENIIKKVLKAQEGK